jgi:hypothetical protein
MLHTYTPENVGGRIKGTSNHSKKNLYFGKSNVVISERDDGRIVIEVQEGFKTTKIISNVELEFQKHPTDNYFYPVLDVELNNILNS